LTSKQNRKIRKQKRKKKGTSGREIKEKPQSRPILLESERKTKRAPRFIGKYSDVKRASVLDDGRKGGGKEPTTEILASSKKILRERTFPSAGEETRPKWDQLRVGSGKDETAKQYSFETPGKVKKVSQQKTTTKENTEIKEKNIKGEQET